MREYPKGAISSINELLLLTGQPVFTASREHSQGHVGAKVFTGSIKSHQYKFKQDYYHSYQVEYPYGCKYHSLQDMNVIENGYNDWFMFANREDAEIYLAN